MCVIYLRCWLLVVGWLVFVFWSLRVVRCLVFNVWRVWSSLFVGRGCLSLLVLVGVHCFFVACCVLFGVWRLVFGVWCLVFGVFLLA